MEDSSASGIHVSFRAGDSIVDPDEQQPAIFIIDRGTVELVMHGQNGKSDPETLEVGDFFGRIALGQEQASGLSAKACSDCRLLRIDNELLPYVLKERPEVAQRLIIGFDERWRRAVDQGLEHRLSADRLREKIDELLQETPDSSDLKEAAEALNRAESRLLELESECGRLREQAEDAEQIAQEKILDLERQLKEKKNAKPARALVLARATAAEMRVEELEKELDALRSGP